MCTSANRGFRRGVRTLSVCAGGVISLWACATATATDIAASWLTATSDNWSVSSRWSGGVVPSNNGSNFYLVTLGVTGTPYTVTTDAPFTVKDLTLSSADATLQLGTQTLSLTRDFSFTAGTVTSTNRAGLITAAGTTTLNGSVFEMARLNTTGTLVFAGSGTNDICDTEVDHEGTAMSWTGNGTIQMDAGATGGRIINGATSTFTISGDGTVTQATGPQSTFENRGVMIKSGSLGTTLFDVVKFQNSKGKVEVATGTLKIVDSAEYDSGQQKLTGGGWVVDAGATLDFNGNTITKNGADVTLNGLNSTFAAINGLTENSAGGKFTVKGGRTFNTAASFTNDGTLTVGAGSTFRVAAGGTFTAGSGSVVDLAGTLKYDGAAITLIAGNKVTLRSGGALLNQFGANALAGFNSIGSGGTFEVIGRNYSFASGLTLGTGANLTIGAAGAGNSSTVTVSGLTVYGLGSTLNIVNGSIVSSGTLLQQGVLKGGGVVQADVVSEGEIAPGASPGTLTIQGNLQINPGSVYHCELAGVNTGQFDVLDVQGVLSFGSQTGGPAGTFDLILLPGFVATLGQQFEVLRFRQFTGPGFDSVIGLQTRDYGFTTRVVDGSFQVIVTRVPAPGTLALAGLTGLLATRRRRA